MTQDAPMLPPRTRGALTVVGRLVMAASLVFLAVSLARQLGDLPPIQLTGAVAFAIMLAVASSLLANLLGAVAWSRLIPRDQRKNPFGTAFCIWAKSNIAKYLPGNVFHYAGRLALATKAGLPVGAVVISMVLEAALLCAAPLILVGVGVLTGSLASNDVATSIGWGQGPRYPLLALVALVLVVGLAAVLFRRQVRSQAASYLSGVPALSLVAALACYVVNFLAMGMAAHILLNAIWTSGSVDWFALVCVYGLAFLVGYVVPGAPGGIGIREVAMIGLLGPAIGLAPVLGLAILLRVASIVADVLTFAIASFLREEPA